MRRADPVARRRGHAVSSMAQLPESSRRAVNPRRTPPPASLPPRRRAAAAKPGGDGSMASSAIPPVSLRSMDRPSLLRRLPRAMRRWLSLHCCPTMIVRCVVQKRSNESRKMIRAHITLSARAICVSTESAHLRAQNLRRRHRDRSVLRPRRAFLVVRCGGGACAVLRSWCAAALVGRAFGARGARLRHSRGAPSALAGRAFGTREARLRRS